MISTRLWVFYILGGLLISRLSNHNRAMWDGFLNVPNLGFPVSQLVSVSPPDTAFATKSAAGQSAWATQNYDRLSPPQTLLCLHNYPCYLLALSIPVHPTLSEIDRMSYSDRYSGGGGSYGGGSYGGSSRQSYGVL